MNCLSLDFGGSSVKYAVVSENAEILHHGQVAAPISSCEVFLETVDTLYRSEKHRVSGISLSLPGVIDSSSGMLLSSGAYASILAQKNVVQLISDRCGVPVAVENDGKCGALSEAWCGALKDVSCGVVLILGTGIGGGVILDGKLHHGAGFCAGEFSYVSTENYGYSLMSQAWMNVGVFGMTYKACKYKNLSFDVQDAAPLLHKFDPLLCRFFPPVEGESKPIKADGKQILQWYQQGDADATKIYRDLIHSLAVLILNIQLCIAPQRIVIGGGLSRFEPLISDVEAELAEAYTGGLMNTTVHSHLVRSSYLADCNLLGAACNFFQKKGAL